VEDYLLVVE